MIDEPDLALLTHRLGQHVGSQTSHLEQVIRDDAGIVLAVLEASRQVTDQHQLAALLNGGAESGSPGDGIHHQGDEDVGRHGHHGFHVSLLFVGVELGVCHRHHLDVQLLKLLLGAFDEGTRPVRGGVHQDGGGVILRLSLGLLLGTECYLGIGGGRLTVRSQRRRNLLRGSRPCEQHGPRQPGC